MPRYSVLVFFHVASVIVWLGTGLTVALISLYAMRARDRLLLEHLSPLVGWLGVRVLAPASLAALGFGIAAAHEGHWPRVFWFKVGEVAFGYSFVTTVALRVPLLRLVKLGKLNPLRLARFLFAIGLVELAVLFVAVGDMVVKPTSNDTSAVMTGVALVGASLVLAASTAVRGRDRDRLDLVEGTGLDVGSELARTRAGALERGAPAQPHRRAS